MLYSLNLAEDGRILSACVVLPNGTYENVVNELPTGETDKEKDITNWLYVDGEYVYDPLPDPEPIEPEPTTDEILDVLLGIGGDM